MSNEQVKIIVANTSSALAPLVAPLFIVGGDVVHKALAQVVHHDSNCVHVAFGFGWLQYALSSLAPVISGERKVLPAPEIRDMQVMNMTAGHARTNHSFVLSRLLRDLEKQVDSKPGKVGGLSVTVVDTMENPTKKMKRNERDQYLGFAFDQLAIPAQLAIALYTGYQKDGLMVSVVSFLGIILSLATEKLPVWKKEKFAARHDNGNYALMRGNGNRHVFIIRNKSADAWNLEDLAAASINDYDWYNWEGAAAVGLAIGWFVLFGLACSLKENVGFFLAIMTVGHIGNLYTATYPRRPAFHGFHLDMANRQTFSNRKVMVTLNELEFEHEGYGQKLLNTFFPGGVWEEDKTWWADCQKKKAEVEKANVEKVDAERVDVEKTGDKQEEKGEGFQIVG